MSNKRLQTQNLHSQNLWVTNAYVVNFVYDFVLKTYEQEQHKGLLIPTLIKKTRFH